MNIMPYNNATICLNGHVISNCNSNHQNYCSKCGAETYSFCSKCHTPIRGTFDIPRVIILGQRDYQLPHYCHECGSPYPWTQKILDNCIELLSLDDDLDDNSKELIKNAHYHKLSSDVIPKKYIDIQCYLSKALKYS